MRTTLTLDDDVQKALDRTAQRRGEPVKTVVNAALRAGLAALERAPAKRGRFRTRAVDGGRCKLPSLDDVAGVLAALDGDDRP